MEDNKYIPMPISMSGVSAISPITPATSTSKLSFGMAFKLIKEHPGLILATIVMLVLMVIYMVVYFRGFLGVGPFDKSKDNSKSKKSPKKEKDSDSTNSDAETDNLIKSINSAAATTAPTSK